MTLTDDTVIISRKTWDELYKSDYYRELLEALEDTETLRKAKEDASDFMSFREFDKKRSQKKNV